MSVSERCPPSLDASPKAARSSGVCTWARVSDPMRRKLAGWPGSVFSAVLTFTRGISSIFRSMNAFTPTTPPRTSGTDTASATAKRPSRTRGNERVIEGVMLPARAPILRSLERPERRLAPPLPCPRDPRRGADDRRCAAERRRVARRPPRHRRRRRRAGRIPFRRRRRTRCRARRIGPRRAGGARPAAAGMVGGVPELRARRGGRARHAASDARTAAIGEPTLPDLVLARFPARLVLDPASGRSELHGQGEARDVLAQAVEVVRAGARAPASPALPRWSTSLDRAEFEQRVATILEHIGAGDCYQVNLTRRLTCEQAADPVGLFSAIDRCNPSPHGALLRFGGAPGTPTVAVVSASPERFLSWRGRDAETRPIKGTGTDPTALASSAKDRAENVMIVDLARNDFGRVCEPGSVVVPALCELEAASRPAPPREHRARAAARRHRDRRAGARRRSHRRR